MKKVILILIAAISVIGAAVASIIVYKNRVWEE